MECIVPITLFALAGASSLPNFPLSPGVYVTEDDLRGGHCISMEVHQNETLQLKMVTKGGVTITSPILEAYPSRDACHTLSPPLGTNRGFGQFCGKFNKLFGTHINIYSLQLCRREGILYLEYESENVRLYRSGDAKSRDLAHIDKQKNVLRESEGKDAPSVKKRRQDEHSYAKRKMERKDAPSVKKRRQDEHSYIKRKTGRKDSPPVKKRRQDEHSYIKRKTGRKDSPPVKKRRQDEHSHAKRKMERKDAPSVKKRRQEFRQMLLPVEGSYSGQWKSELRISLEVCEASAAFSFERLAAMRYAGWMKLKRTTLGGVDCFRVDEYTIEDSGAFHWAFAEAAGIVPSPALVDICPSSGSEVEIFIGGEMVKLERLKSYTSSSDMSGVTQSAGTADGQHNSGDIGRIENPVDPPIPTIADLKAARKLARCRRTKTANRLQRVKALIAEYEGPVDGVELEEDEEYAKLQEEEESLEQLLIEGQLAAANAERAVSDRLRDDLSQRLPFPSLSVGRESQAFVTPDAFGDSPSPAAHTDGRQARTDASVTETFPAAPPPPVAVPSPAVVPSVVRSLAPQPSVRSRASSSKDAIGKLVIPHLLDKYEVLSHINMFCLILSDNGYGQYDGERFVPAERETTIVVRLLETLEKCPEVHAFAESTARSSQYGWDQTIDILKKRFGSKVSLRGEANRRLKALRFLGPSMAEGFNQEVVVIANLWLSVYGKEGAEGVAYYGEVAL
ncbi:hypothetical protein FOZ63_032176 [Perkinsus olseni]|uniref:Uncharacterized protein n=1 Tax=Perkinsus olseni TaxID=32597 RepID=A0A7J6U101_PEROL|nr:hypothetical protein FOZ63_032176 [Perkinsus olseni]